MPRKSDLQMEQVATASPVRRSGRLTATSSTTLSTENSTKSITTRRSSVKEESNETRDLPTVSKVSNRRRCKFLSFIK